MGDLSKPLPGQAIVTWFNRNYAHYASRAVSALRLEMDDGTILSIEMVDKNEVAMMVYPSWHEEPECVWSQLLNQEGT